jgi:hypothetical protein
MAFNGIGGSVLSGTIVLTGISEWSLDASMSPVETTEFGEGDDSYIGSTRTRTGSFSGNTDNADAGQAALITAFDAGTPVALKLYENSTKYWNVGTAFITGMSDSLSVKGKGEKSFSFQVSGPVTYV